MNQISQTGAITEGTGRWGAELLAGGGARFRLWTQGENAISLRHRDQDIPMQDVGGGWFEATVAEASAGTEASVTVAGIIAVPASAERGGVMWGPP